MIYPPDRRDIKHDVAGFVSSEEAAEFVFLHPGRLDAVVIFDLVADAGGSFYRLWVNNTAEPLYAFPQDDPWHYAALQNALNRAIVSQATGSAASIRANIKPFTDQAAIGMNFEERLSDASSSIPVFGAVFIVMGVTAVGVLVLQLVTGEKRQKLLGFMRVMGLSEAAYVLSHWVALCIASAGSAAIFAVLVPSVTEVKVFTKTDAGVLFVVHWVFLTTTCSFALCIASIVSSANVVQILSALIFATSLFHTMFTATEIFSIPSWDNSYSPDSNMGASAVLFFMPWFHYGKIFTNIIATVGVVGSNEMGNSTLSFTMEVASKKVGDMDGNPRCLDGFTSVNCADCKVGFGTKDTYPANDTIPYEESESNCCCSFKIESDGKRFISPLEFADGRVGAPFGWRAPSPLQSVAYMVALNIIYLCGAWYLGQVGFASDAGGAKRMPWFVFLREYWAGKATLKEGIVDGDTRSLVQQDSLQKGTIRTNKLSKSYASTTALRELSLTMRRGEVFCLLGQNGAGKTTIINCLTGLVNPSAGSAFVFGLDVESQISQIQQLMGVCPQHDILFEELTAKQHLLFWSRFKGSERGEKLEHYIQTILADINLQKNGDALASTFSGGMKRRLSVGISTTGNPSVVFMDEPSTGLDPLSRRRIWSMIEKIKVGRVVVLTTHSMEEADALSDQIAIMGEGRLRALGTSLFLKDRFGTGFSAGLLCDESNSAEVLEHAIASLPGCEVLTNTAGYINIGIPKRIVRRVPGYFASLESRVGTGALVKEWGISNSKLEDVFLRLVGKSDQVNRLMGNAVEQDASLQLAATFDSEDEKIIISPLGDSFTVTCTDAQGEKTMELEPVTLFSGGTPISETLFRLVEDLQPVQATIPPSIEDVAPSTTTISKITIPTLATRPNVSTLTNDASKSDNVELEAGLQSPTSILGDPRSEQRRVGSTIHQVGALVMKDFALLTKNNRGACCRICCCSSCSGVLVLMSLIFQIADVAISNARDRGTYSVCEDGSNYLNEKVGGVRLNPWAETEVNTRQTLLEPAYWDSVFVESEDEFWTKTSGDTEQSYWRVDLCKKRGFVKYLANKGATAENAERLGSGLTKQACVLDDNGSAESERLSRMYESNDFVFDKKWHESEVCRITSAEELSTFHCSIDNASVITDYCLLKLWTSKNEELNTAQLGLPIDKARIWLDLAPDLVTPLSAKLLFGEGFNKDTDKDLVLLHTDACGKSGVYYGLKSTDYSSPDGVGDNSLVTRCSGLEVKMMPGMSERVQANQARLESQAASGTTEREIGASNDGKCNFIDSEFTSSSENFVYAGNHSMAMNKLGHTFPDVGLYVAEANAKTMELHFTLHLFASTQPRAEKVYESAYFFGNFPINPFEGEGRRESRVDPLACGRIGPSILRLGTTEYLGAYGWNSAFWLDSLHPPLLMSRPLMALTTRIINALLEQRSDEKGSSAGLSSNKATIHASVITMPSASFSFGGGRSFKAVQFLKMLTILYTTFISMMYWPTLIDRVRTETKERLVVMLQIQGASLTAYWLATYAFHLTLYTVFVCLGFVGVQLGVGNTIFTQGSTWQITLVLIFWGHSLIGMGVLLSAVMQRTSMVNVVAWMIVSLFSFMTSVILRYVTTWTTGLLMFPPTNFVRAISLAMSPNGAANSTIAECVALQFVFGLTCLMVGIVIHYSRLLDDTGNNLARQVFNTLKRSMGKSSALVAVARPSHHRDDDVVAEDVRARNLAGSEVAIRLVDLSKEFPGLGPQAPPHVAVAGVTMAIDYDECFCLLGPNGAGKTTTINMLCGFLAKSSGSASVGGFNLDDINEVRSVLGVCPQFDTVWPEMTVEEHLKLYARIKGATRAEESAEVQRVAELVSLDGDAFKRRAKQLSGGMLRRLSIAIALVGNPPVLFFDEPTTGLDPETRQTVWKIMKAAQHGRAIILTTHSMEEADALSSRIGIMANGSLRCVGTQLRLKNQYGQGYRLKTHISAGIKPSTVDDFVRNSLCPNAALVDSDSGPSVRTFCLPQAEIKVSTIFRLLEENKSSIGISEWSLNQTSLEEVFFRIARAAEEEQHTYEHGLK